jgi:RNA polymerase sigma-70 factor (family 1)
MYFYQNNVPFLSIKAHTDDTLVALLRDGDESAFTELYNRYWEKMTIVAFTKLGTAEDAKETVQDVFADLWHRRARLQLRHSFHTYITAAVTYKVFTLLAKRKKSRDQYSLLESEGVDDSTRQWLTFVDLQEELEKILLTLPEKCRLVFQLSREEGLSHQEISKLLDIAPKTVEAHLSRALRSFRLSLRHFFTFFY